MTWFKVDDTFWGHRKVLLTSNAAVGLFVRCGSWSSQALTEGFIPSEVMPVLGKPGEVAQLVKVVLFEALDGGWQIHDFLDYNPTKEKVLAERLAAAKRQRMSRGMSQQMSRRDSRVTHIGSHTPPVPEPVPVQRTSLL